MNDESAYRHFNSGISTTVAGTFPPRYARMEKSFDSRTQANKFACSPAQNNKTTYILGGFVILCGRRESNPDPILGKD